MKIKDLCASERPREKMLSLGAESLSDSELIALLLRGGTKKESALDIARRLLSESDGYLSRIYEGGVDNLSAVSGVGPCKACEIMAALELGKRFVSEKSSIVRRPIVGAAMVNDIMAPLLRSLDHEESWLVLLNTSMYLIDKVRLTSGSDNSTCVDIKKVLRIAIQRRANHIILVHNHPSSNPRPSESDMALTRNLCDAARAFGISLLDHLVISDSGYYSFNEERLVSTSRG